MQSVLTYLKLRAPLLAVAGFFGAASSWGNTPARTDDLGGLQIALGDGELLVQGVVWEKTRGVLLDFLFGRPVLFEAAAANDPNARQDIFRAFVRLSPEGRVLDVRSTRNLTGTRSANEYGLGSQGDLAWFGSSGKETPGSVTFLNLKGERVATARHSLLERLQLGMSRFLETGTWAGLGRTDLFSAGIPVSISVGDSVSITGENVSVSLSPQELFTGPEIKKKNPHLTFIPRHREPGNWFHWAADAGRHVVGSGAIAWAEGRAFSLWDNLHQATYSVSSTYSESSRGSSDPVTKVAPPSVEQTNQVWPPADIQQGASTSHGKWKPVKRTLLPQSDPPLFYRTVLRPDPKRPYAELHLVAFDMRRLELGIGAGYEDPRPDTGPPGSGQIPEDVAPQVVATFNGAFKSIHGQYGMKADGRLLVEPVVGAATVVVDSSGSAGLGTWEKDQDSSEFPAFRQNLDPLVARGLPNPEKRKVWGDHLYGSGVAVERSALCYHKSGQLLYAWGTEATGESLAEGLARAGCVYAIHLDMNPGHCAFVFNKVESVKPLRAEGEPLDPRMRVSPTRFLRWSPKDFFYLKLRKTPSGDPSVVWTAAPGEHPPPESIPAFLLGKKMVGSLSIELDRIDATRLRFSAVPGSAEFTQIEDTPPPPVESPLIGWGLGHRTRGHRTGLSIGESVLVPLHRNYASVLISDGTLRILPPAEPQTEKEGVQIIQLPALARDGELLPIARELGGNRKRAAMCLDDGGTLLIARMVHDTSAPIVQELLSLGCTLVVEMDRGSHPPPVVERSGTEAPPQSPHEQTFLYGYAAPMSPRTYLF